MTITVLAVQYLKNTGSAIFYGFRWEGRFRFCHSMLACPGHHVYCFTVYKVFPRAPFPFTHQKKPSLHWQTNIWVRRREVTDLKVQKSEFMGQVVRVRAVAGLLVSGCQGQ